MDVLQYLPRGALVNIITNKDKEIAELKAKIEKVSGDALTNFYQNVELKALLSGRNT